MVLIIILALRLLLADYRPTPITKHYLAHFVSPTGHCGGQCRLLFYAAIVAIWHYGTRHLWHYKPYGFRTILGGTMYAIIYLEG